MMMVNLNFAKYSLEREWTSKQHQALILCESKLREIDKLIYETNIFKIVHNYSFSLIRHPVIIQFHILNILIEHF